jgi:hypothetical protein
MVHAAQRRTDPRESQQLGMAADISIQYATTPADALPQQTARDEDIVGAEPRHQVSGA